MQLNADFTQRAVVHPQDADWVTSPAGGVDRLMLDRIGDEVARATSIVRYAPGSAFPAHTHEQGEEFLVLDGIFSDEHGDYLPGTYVRNPPGSSHSPRSDGGCVIFVKLRQFADDDTARVVVDTSSAEWRPADEPGVNYVPLHTHGTEQVALVRLAPDTRSVLHSHDGGEEAFVVDGGLSDEHGTYRRWAWVRNPPGSAHEPWTDTGCVLYVKVGHLAGQA